MAEELDLPFQWDDGVFISPFVRSEDSSATSLVHVLRCLAEQEGYSSTSLSFADLGCGDGKVVFRVAADFPSWPCVGYDLDEDLIQRATSSAAALSLDPHRVRFVHSNLLEEPTKTFEQHQVIFMYLLPDALLLLKEKIEALFHLPTTLLMVSNNWTIPYLEEFLVPESKGSALNGIRLYRKRPLNLKPV
jgi:hypothetical protein